MAEKDIINLTEIIKSGLESKDNTINLTKKDIQEIRKKA